MPAVSGSCNADATPNGERRTNKKHTSMRHSARKGWRPYAAKLCFAGPAFCEQPFACLSMCLTEAAGIWSEWPRYTCMNRANVSQAIAVADVLVPEP